ncbi:MAG: Rieske 2Fe-2S domain-containing protein [Deltaproteobacteria bacterium]|jgi:nitrite reductase/ring-hydroxylating ferredoxin subunit|nr:Rieske 2Fe-2S domain-containing protein [Deltaproteobacteria bacterium]MBT6434884.1 Rieske 2Fe-2S domain-containing protein [Deltaproteobacteria bacterium]MBT6491195.1 Rieske 2Fe-2S domain-containing protein [Deltaproteobacteria bacterium]
MRKAPTDGHTRFENLGTQPLKTHRVFNNPDVVPEGWYPVCSSKHLKKGKADSFLLTFQRVCVYRTHEGDLAALDAFCPHMGADLANGRVVDGQIECYFHQWRYGKDGELTGSRCGVAPRLAAVQSWPVEEAYGYIWVYSAPEAPYPVPKPSGLENEEVSGWCVANLVLYAHHHVMMVGGIDLQHFATVHNIEIDFELEVDEHSQYMATWKLDGTVPKKGWRGTLANWLLGGRVNYHARVAGGSIVSLTYGPDLKVPYLGWKVPPLYVLWGCTADENGIGHVQVFAVAKNKKGFTGWLSTQLKLFATVLLLGVLKDDDEKAFPFMRFNIGRLVKEDACLSRMVKFLNGLPISKWSKRQLTEGSHGEDSQADA